MLNNDRGQSVEFVNVTVKKFRSEIYVNYGEDSYFEMSERGKVLQLHSRISVSELRVVIRHL